MSNKTICNCKKEIYKLKHPEAVGKEFLWEPSVCFQTLFHEQLSSS